MKGLPGTPAPSATPPGGPTPLAAPSGFTATAWVLLDWAGSGFSTVLITLIVAYVDKVVFAGNPWGLAPGIVWP